MSAFTDVVAALGANPQINKFTGGSSSKIANTVQAVSAPAFQQKVDEVVNVAETGLTISLMAQIVAATSAGIIAYYTWKTHSKKHRS